MRSTLRVGAACAIALATVCLVRIDVLAGGGIPESDGKKVEPDRPSPGREPEVIKLAPTRRKAGAGARGDSTAPAKRLRAEEVAPREALFFVSVADVSRLGASASELAIADILAEEAIGSQFEAFMDGLRGSPRGNPGPGLPGLLRAALSADVDMDVVRTAIRKQIALIGLPPAKGDEGLRLAAVAACGASGRRPMIQVMETLVGELHSRYRGAYEPLPEEHGGTEIRGLKLEGVEISYALYENLLLVGTGKGTLVSLIDSHLGGPDKQLAGLPAFKAASDDLGKGADIFYRVDVQGITKAMGPLVAAAAGPSRSGPVAGAVYFDGKSIRERIEAVPLEGQKASPIISGEPLTIPPKSLSVFPVDTALYVAASLDSAEVMAEIAKDPQAAAAMQQLGAMAKLVGIDAARDVIPVLPAFGGEIAAGIVLPRGHPAEILLVLEVKRKDLLARAEDTIEKLAGGQMKEVHYRNVRIRYAEPPKTIEDAAPMQYVLPSLSCARVGHDLFVVASSRRAMEKAIRQRNFPQSSLREKDDYRRCLSGLKPRRKSILYVDARKVLEVLKGPVITPIGVEVPTGLGGSPVLSALERHIFGFGVVSGESKDSAFVESCGPLGPVTGAGIGALAALQSALGEGGADAPKRDAENLTRIGVALHLYATDFDRFPARLSELYDEYLTSLKHFMAPGGKKAVKNKDDIDERGDYVYVRGLSPSDLSDAIVAYSREALNSPGGEGRNVLYVDGRVEFLIEADIESALERAGKK